MQVSNSHRRVFQCHCMPANKWQPSDYAWWPPSSRPLSQQHLTIHISPQSIAIPSLLYFCPSRLSCSNQEKFRFPELAYLLQGCFYSLLTNMNISRLVKQQFSNEGEGGRQRGGRDKTRQYGKVFHRATVRCLLYTHMPNEKKNHQISQNNLI